MAELFETFLRNQGRAEPLWRKRIAVLALGSLLLHASSLAALFYVPAVRDALNIAALLVGTEYVDEQYRRIKLERATVVQILSERFQYPPGYFAKPEPPATRAMPVAQRPRPKPRPTPTPRPERNAPDPQQLADAATSPEKAEQLLDQQAAAARVKRPPRVNKRPFVDLLAKAKSMADRGELKLDGTILMTIEADRRDDGTLENVRITSAQTTNRALYTLAEEFVQALSASRVLAFLEGAKRLRMTLKLDQRTLSVRAATEVESAARAAEMARGYSGLLIVERIRKRGSDEAVIWNSTTVSSQGKQVLVKFEMARDVAGQIVAKQLPSG
ncbi:MAG: hypothetical protein C4334_13260 [Pyrinomonas sp.]|uniref:hypothetical protein n=1 Tax=Pyrinomonas sp. TaxID=2080306 RepID=UPI003332FD6E